MSRVRSNRVCFTLNNYTVDDCQTILDLENHEDLIYMVVGEEEGESGTPHLQGFVHWKKAPKECGLKFWKELMPFSQAAHFENARGSDEDNQKYCTKSGPSLEFGQPGKAKVSRFRDLFEATKRSVAAAMEMDPEFTMRNYSNMQRIHDDFCGDKPEFDYPSLLPWQEKAVEMLEQQNRRQILFIVDPEGGKGKTILSIYLQVNKNCVYLCGAKSMDLAHIYSKNKQCEVVIFDMSKCTNPDYWPYNLMEQMKNGMVISTKYNSKTIFTKSKKIIVFSNEEPDREKLTKDRYQILRI